MPTQLALSFDAVPVTCEVQQRYHSIAPCLAGISTPAEQAQALNLGYSTVTRWLRQFREKGLPGLFPETQYPREPYTPERVIVQLIFFKCCAPKAGDRELARVIHHLTGHQLHRSVDLIYLCLEGGRRLEICHLTSASAKAFCGRDWHEVSDYSALEAQAKDAARTRFIRSEAEAHALPKQIGTEAMEKTLAARASAGRQSKSARTQGISVNRALERQSERNQEGWRLDTKEPALSPPTPPAADDQEEGYVPPTSKVSRIRELRDKEWNKQ